MSRSAGQVSLEGATPWAVRRRRRLRGLAVALALALLAACNKAPEPPAQQEEPPAPSFDAKAFDAVLTRAVDGDTGEPTEPVTVLPETETKITVAMHYTGPAEAEVTIHWVAVSAERAQPGEVLLEIRDQEVRPGRWTQSCIPCPHNGFLLGDYRVDVLAPDGRVIKSLPFAVTPILPPAEPATAEKVPAGANIALATLGGRIESINVETGDRNWSAQNLNDGIAAKDYAADCAPSCGWSARGDFPFEMVFSFYQQRAAVVSAVVLDTVTDNTKNDSGAPPKHVEIWAATDQGDFTQLAAARIPPRPDEYVFRFAPRSARFIKVVIRSSHAGNSTGGRAELGEVRIIEPQEAAESVIDLQPRNLALPALGGSLVWFSSQDKFRGYVNELVDGQVSAESGWMSGLGPEGKADYLPQDFVFAFHGDQAALVDRVVLNPLSGPPNPQGPDDPMGRPTWVKAFSVAVSTDSPFDGFEEVGRFTLPREPGYHAFPVGRMARYLRIRVLENYGGPLTRLGEVLIREGTAPDYVSILRTGSAAAPREVAGASRVAEAGALPETEPNNDPAGATPLALGQRTWGTIDPLGELDYFRVTVPGDGRQVLTMDVAGRPNLRTSFTLLDPAGRARYELDPGRQAAGQTRFSLAVDSGDYLVKMTQPPVSVVLIWDTSGSMRGSEQNLQRAVESYLDQVQPGERLNLIRFSDSPEVLLDQFTSDREQLKAAVAGKFAPDGGTSLYDAIARGIELLKDQPGNRAIVVMTDGADTSSERSHQGFWGLLRQERIRLYTIGLGSLLRSDLSHAGTTAYKVLAHAATATNGRFFFSPDSADLGGVYQQIAEDLGQRPVYYLQPSLGAGSGSLAVVATGERIEAVSAPPQVELILDASGSMKRKLGGKMMIDVAKEVMAGVIESLPDGIQVGLRVYGHRVREGQAGDCEDSEMVFPFAPVDKPRLLEGVRAINALGTTPIAYSLRQIANDLGAAPGEKLVVLLTDGKEECDGDIAAAVAELQARGLKLRLDVVGFALADAATKEELRKVAGLTGGRFFDARDGAGLRRAIDQAMGVPFDVVDAAGQVVAAGLTGAEPVSVPAGVYTIVVRAAGEPIRIPDVTIASDQATRVELHKEGQEIGTRVIVPEKG